MYAFFEPILAWCPGIVLAPVFGYWFLRDFLAGRKVGTLDIDHNQRE